jgi:hypothetical protein
MSFLRHIGKHGDRKVAVVFREVPNEGHMCLVVYTELLNRHIHDPMMKCIESDIGQHSETLADALNRSFTVDGKPLLQVLHFEGQLKKVKTELVVMTPAPNVKIKLNELNVMLNEMKQGEEAVKRLSELDKSRGLQDPADVARRMRTNQTNQTEQPAETVGKQSYLPTDMTDAAIAWRLRQQAQKMEAEARGLLSESTRLMKEAAQMEGQPESTPASVATPKVEISTEQKKVVVAARRPGRPKKAA